MIDQLTFRDEVHEASVGDVDAVLDFEPSQLGASPRDDGQASIGQPRTPVQGQTLRRVLGRVSRQQPHDRLQGQVGIGVLSGEGDLVP